MNFKSLIWLFLILLAVLSIRAHADSKNEPPQPGYWQNTRLYYFELPPGETKQFQIEPSENCSVHIKKFESSEKLPSIENRKKLEEVRVLTVFASCLKGGVSQPGRADVLVPAEKKRFSHIYISVETNLNFRDGAPNKEKK